MRYLASNMVSHALSLQGVPQWVELQVFPAGCAKFPRQMFSEDVQNVPKGAPPPSGPLPVMLNSEETAFADMRDLNFRAVGQYLAIEAKKVTAAFEERHGAKTVSQLKQFVQKLPHMQQAKQSLSRR